MPTTFGELKRLVFLELRRSDGEAELAIEEGINRAHKAIARVQDFEELMVLDTTNAETTVDVKQYHLITDLGLTLPKDIYSIRLIDDANSRKLVWVPIRDFDAIIPYPEMVGTFKPKWYVQRGMSLELYPIPNDTYPLYIQYSQWPSPLVEEDDETPYMHLDDVLVALGAEMAMAILEGGAMTGWDQRAQNLLGVALREEWSKPDQVHIARPFRAGKTRITGEYWLDPFIKEVNQ